MSNIVLARRGIDGHIVSLSVGAIEAVERGNFGSTHSCIALAVSGEKYTIDPDQFETLRKVGFLP